ncbi:hypothetical protein GMOD_00006223 [Pyrenophora seminiperda CCB06]|uniref:Uncharacterized protein n=1 Tax=Pyrenophora seminiperda CCB06 TaxID=1302712 RepID=A0A3M7M4M9_9PLEO|nr:hypothetical protein GMOD_00006223 [Pyrenophora seminiperda CCB06]
MSAGKSPIRHVHLPSVLLSALGRYAYLLLNVVSPGG